MGLTNEFLQEANEDMGKLEDQLSNTKEALMEQLDSVSHKLKEKAGDLQKSLKKEMKIKAVAYYHENKKVIDSDLKKVNESVKILLNETKSQLKTVSVEVENEHVQDMLKALYKDVAKFSRKYTFGYQALKLKLAFESAGYQLKNIFKK